MTTHVANSTLKDAARRWLQLRAAQQDAAARLAHAKTTFDRARIESECAYSTLCGFCGPVTGVGTRVVILDDAVIHITASGAEIVDEVTR